MRLPVVSRVVVSVVVSVVVRVVEARRARVPRGLRPPG
jgi:hypothetical protein